jgi:hypothetical protein
VLLVAELLEPAVVPKWFAAAEPPAVVAAAAAQVLDVVAEVVVAPLEGLDTAAAVVWGLVVTALAVALGHFAEVGPAHAVVVVLVVRLLALVAVALVPAVGRPLGAGPKQISSVGPLVSVLVAAAGAVPKVLHASGPIAVTERL